ncbi:DUF1573 domain-containing protein [Flavobacterium sp. CHNK8]|uniref:Ig-like domain-containing protein n=1 Tax=Flavobacterium sp. CHNK8 TaxID=2871165 RepID=UPI001C8E3F22|nr:DUF1573 domain-containing protein [Flavobacterium sp. CHNK8]QZK91308.1 DUF1573 domain-containing protein [Flavobacterium sp. CHNK8]
MKTILSTIILFSLINVASAQVNVQGNISFSTTWTKALSPYKIIGDVQVPSGVTLTIEPGVEIRYTGDYELLVKGRLEANGTQPNTIVFRSDVSGMKKGKRFLNFAATNLATHKLSYIKMLDGNIGIQVGNESEFQQGDKNTGKLTIDNLQMINTNILTGGYQTGAELLLSNGSFESGQILGEYPRSEKISLNNMQLINATLFSDSYNSGIWLDGCNVKNTTWKIGCCGANFNIKNSVVEGGSFVPTNDYYDINIDNSQITNLPMNLRLANKVSINKSVIFGEANIILSCNNLTMNETSIRGSGNSTGLELYGTNTINQSTISGMNTGIKVNTNGNLTITNSNFLQNNTFNIQNLSSNNLTATQNWWGTNNITDINKLLWDKNDDINKGTINFSNQLTDSKTTAPITPPLNVVKITNGSNVVLKWTANTETDISGYKIYYGSTDGIHFTNVINAGNATTYTLTSTIINDIIAVTAHDLSADGVNDKIEGHESWYSIAGAPSAIISLSTTNINMDVVQLNNTVSKKILITNKGGADLVISNITLNSSLFSVDNTSFTIKPDEVYELTVNFKPVYLGQVNTTLTLNHNSKENTSTVNLSGMGVLDAGTGVCGLIAQNATWTKALSPYYILCDVQVPSGVTLTIEPGVEIRYTGDYELLVKGRLEANGTQPNTIVFRSDVSGMKKGKRFLNFAATNLATHKLSYIKMLDGNIGIQVGNESEFQQGDKNTGKLTIDNLQMINTNILTGGYQTGAELLLSNGSFESGQILGEYPRSEKISLNNMQLINATLFSDSYNSGIWLDGCNVKNTTWKIGCCGANFNIKNSIVEGGSFIPTNNYYDISIDNSQITNLPMNLSQANNVSINKSVIFGEANIILSCNNLTMNETSIRGSGNSTGLELYGTNTINQSTISGMNTGIKVNTNGNLTITNSNFLQNNTFNIQNLSSNNLTATQNWWGTNNITDINKLLWDKNDDINKGTINFSNQLTDSKTTAPITPPLNVVKITNGSNVVLKWTANTETDISGYKIYYGSTDGIHFTNVINAGNATTYTLTSTIINDIIAVTAHDLSADGVNDKIEGHESWYSIAGAPSAIISLSTTNINMDVVQLNNTVSKKILITNKGGADLVISNITLNSSLFSVDNTSFTIKPDEVYELTVNFKPVYLGQVNTTLTLNHNSKENTSTVNLSGMGVLDAGTGVCGLIAQNATWTKALSPYYILCDVQVPSGVTLTIEPGVEIRYTGDYELLVKGRLEANGTQPNTIVFRSDVSGMKKGKRFLNFAATNLATHKLSYIKMLDGNIGIQVGNESEFQQGDKNTGKLTIDNLQMINTNILTGGYQTGAELLLSNGSFESGQILGEYPRSEKISLNNMQLINATLFSDSYNSGIWLDGCNVKNTTWKIGCCGANFNIKNSIVEGGSFIPTNNYYDISIDNSQITNLPMNLSQANNVSINKSVIFGEANIILSCNNLTMNETSIRGSGNNTGLELYGTNTINQSTISGMNIGIKVNTNGNLTITNSNFLQNNTFNIQNLSSNNLSATQNWWGTIDIGVISEKIFDKFDDINRGEVIYSPLLMAEKGDINYVPVVNNFITPLLGEVPLEVTFTSTATDQDGTIKNYKWDYDGDKVYDFSSELNGNTKNTYTKGGDYIIESNVSDNKNLTNRLFYKISAIDFNSKSKVLDDKTIIVNWGWGQYHTVVVEASAFDFLSDGDIINVYDQNGINSTDCNTPTLKGKTIVSSIVYSSKNDSLYVFNCKPNIDKCAFNSTITPGYTIGNQIYFEIQHGSSTYKINPKNIKSGATLFTDSDFTFISKFEKDTQKSAFSNKKTNNTSNVNSSKNYSYNIYRNNILFKEGVTDLYLLDTEIVENNVYCYDIYIVKDGNQILSKSTCTKAETLNTNENFNDISFIFYPNPANDFLIIKTTELLNKCLAYIYDISGKEVLTQPISNEETKIRIDMLQNGVYLLKIKNNDKMNVVKFIKN